MSQAFPLFPTIRHQGTIKIHTPCDLHGSRRITPPDTSLPSRHVVTPPVTSLRLPSRCYPSRHDVPPSRHVITPPPAHTVTPSHPPEVSEVYLGDVPGAEIDTDLRQTAGPAAVAVVLTISHTGECLLGPGRTDDDVCDDGVTGHARVTQLPQASTGEGNDVILTSLCRWPRAGHTTAAGICRRGE